MRLSTFVGGFALALAVPVAMSAQVVQKFAFINSQAVMQSAPGRGEAELQFQKEMEGFRSQVQKLGDSLNMLDSAYKKEELTLSPAVKEAKLKVLREKQAEYQDRVQKLNDQAQAREGELMQPILDNVRRVLDDIRAEAGYSFIFDVSAGAVIVSADKNLDITDRVLAKLKSLAPRAATKAAPGPTSAPAGVTTKKPPTQ